MITASADAVPSSLSVPGMSQHPEYVHPVDAQNALTIPSVYPVRGESEPAVSRRKSLLAPCSGRLYHSGWNLSIAVLSIDEGPLNLIGEARTMLSEERNPSMTSSMPSSRTHPPEAQLPQPVQWPYPPA